MFADMKYNRYIIVIILFHLFHVLPAQDHVILSGHSMMRMADRYEIMSGRFIEGTQLGNGYVFRKHILSLATQKPSGDDNYLTGGIKGLSSRDSFLLFGYMEKDLVLSEDREGAFGGKYKQKYWGNIFNNPAYMMDLYPKSDQPEDMTYRLTINPVLDLHLGKNLEETDRTLMINGRGVEVKGFLGAKNPIGFYSLAVENQVILPEYFDGYRKKYGYIPYNGWNKPHKENGWDFFHARGYVWYDVNPHLNIRFGHDKVHWGPGIRSLVLGDHAPPNLFMMLNTNVGRIHFQNYFAEFIDSTRWRERFGVRDQLYAKKYGTFHRLGINISKNVNISVFEALMFDRQDPGQTNRFDLNYINPVIFLRAVELNMGSQDNMIVGIDAKWNFFKRFQIYGQFILDEFYLKELKAQNGWWANKYSLQGGLKAVNVAGIKNLDLQLEYNMVRPFTYSHFRHGSNWTHFAQSVAHPLGSNFREYLARANYQPAKRVTIFTTLMYAEKGEDSIGGRLNFGGNVLRNYEFNRAKEYDNFIGQGVLSERLLLEVRGSYMLFHNFFIDLRYTYRKDKSIQYLYPQTNAIQAGIRWNIDAHDRTVLE